MKAHEQDELWFQGISAHERCSPNSYLLEIDRRDPQRRPTRRRHDIFPRPNPPDEEDRDAGVVAVVCDSMCFLSPCSTRVQEREAREQEELNVLAETDPAEYDRRIKEWHERKMEERERGERGGAAGEVAAGAGGRAGGRGDLGLEGGHGGDGEDASADMERRKSLARERRSKRYVDASSPSSRKSSSIPRVNQSPALSSAQF